MRVFVEQNWSKFCNRTNSDRKFSLGDCDRRKDAERIYERIQLLYFRLQSPLSKFSVDVSFCFQTHCVLKNQLSISVLSDLEIRSHSMIFSPGHFPLLKGAFTYFVSVQGPHPPSATADEMLTKGVHLYRDPMLTKEIPKCVQGPTASQCWRNADKGCTGTPPTPKSSKSCLRNMWKLPKSSVVRAFGSKTIEIAWTDRDWKNAHDVRTNPVFSWGLQ